MPNEENVNGQQDSNFVGQNQQGSNQSQQGFNQSQQGFNQSQQGQHGTQNFNQTGGQQSYQQGNGQGDQQVSQQGQVNGQKFDPNQNQGQQQDLNNSQNQQQQYQQQDSNQDVNQLDGGDAYNFGGDIVSDMQNELSSINEILNNSDELKTFSSEEIVEMYNLKADLESKINPYLDYQSKQKVSIAEKKLGYLPDDIKSKVLGFVQDLDDISEVEGMSDFVNMIWNAAQGKASISQQQQPQTNGNIKGVVSGGQIPQGQQNDLDPLKVMTSNDASKRAAVKDKMAEMFGAFVNNTARGVK